MSKKSDPKKTVAAKPPAAPVKKPGNVSAKKSNQLKNDSTSKMGNKKPAEAKKTEVKVEPAKPAMTEEEIKVRNYE